MAAIVFMITTSQPDKAPAPRARCRCRACNCNAENIIDYTAIPAMTKPLHCPFLSYPDFTIIINNYRDSFATE